MRALALLVALAAALAAPAAAAERATVLAAASLTDVFPAIDPSPRFSFAGSDTLALQIRQGAPADVYAAASPRAAQALFREGLLERPRVFATNALVLVVPRANPARIRGVADLRRRGLKLVVAQEGVPAGDYTRRALARLRLGSALSNVVSEETDVRGVLAKVALGEADAGFVYATDVAAARGKLRALRLPARAQPGVRYEIAVVRDAPHRAAARRFLAAVLSPRGRARLAAAGFGLP